MDSLKDYITVDCAFGGMWYAIVNIDTNWTVGIPKLDPNNGKSLANLGEEIKVGNFEYEIFLKIIKNNFKFIFPPAIIAKRSSNPTSRIRLPRSRYIGIHF